MQKENIYRNKPYEYRKPQKGKQYDCWHGPGVRTITIYTEPVAKGRPRFTKNGHAYTPQKTADYEDLIRQCWLLAHGKNISTKYIRMDLDFYVPIPKSMSKADKEKALQCELRPDKKPDIDNLIKAIQDALNEVAYWDDKQIVSLRADKWYTTQPRVDIKIEELNYASTHMEEENK